MTISIFFFFHLHAFTDNSRLSAAHFICVHHSSSLSNLFIFSNFFFNFFYLLPTPTKQTHLTKPGGLEWDRVLYSQNFIMLMVKMTDDDWWELFLVGRSTQCSKHYAPVNSQSSRDFLAVVVYLFCTILNIKSPNQIKEEATVATTTTTAKKRKMSCFENSARGAAVGKAKEKHQREMSFCNFSSIMFCNIFIYLRILL